MGHQLWGPQGTRRFFTDAHWKEPLVWNEDARNARRRERVFCASMADVFERRAELNPQRARLWELIERTPHLDWLLLTKRPQNVENMVPWENDWPANVWLGTTVENQELAEKRLPFLLKNHAAIRFLSCEPLLGPIDLSPWFRSADLHPIDWVIAGGESGPRSRPMHPDWAESLLKQCRRARVPFHFKQWGHWVPADISAQNPKANIIHLPSERPVNMIRLPKKEAGRVLAGRTWDGVPRGRLVTNA